MSIEIGLFENGAAGNVTGIEKGVFGKREVLVLGGEGVLSFF
jgi:hypothetical protein